VINPPGNVHQSGILYSLGNPPEHYLSAFQGWPIVPKQMQRIYENILFY
jgi:hypothetical protein